MTKSNSGVHEITKDYEVPLVRTPDLESYFSISHLEIRPSTSHALFAYKFEVRTDYFCDKYRALIKVFELTREDEFEDWKCFEDYRAAFNIPLVPHPCAPGHFRDDLMRSILRNDQEFRNLQNVYRRKGRGLPAALVAEALDEISNVVLTHSFYYVR